ncbi:hypothetical protein, partial [Propionivibrio sp.]|uniref:hypothetical protein n=1 Tax=Propionivibrio sp. TaxID=2212460 RepID=UPI003BF3A2C0
MSEVIEKPETMPIAKPDQAAILAALHVMCDPAEVYELRSFKGKIANAGFYDAEHWSVMAENAARYNAAGFTPCITLNPVDPQ